MRLLITIISLLTVLIGCSREPINSPHANNGQATNTLYTAFTQRSPKYLDPASSYSTDETPFTYSIYEPLYTYHYLKRPYQLQPLTATSIQQPIYFDANGNQLPDDTDGELVAVSQYDITIKPDIWFQPHPAFAQESDSTYTYFPLETDKLKNKFGINDFEKTSSRKLLANDYEYAIKRLASPRVISPIFSLLSEHIVGLRQFGDDLRQHEQQLKDKIGDNKASQQWLDLRDFNFDGVQAIDEHTIRIKVLGKYPQFKYWLAMTFTAPIPWEADRFYSQTGMSAQNLSLNTWPVGTGPYMLSVSIPNRRHVLTRNPNYRGEPYPCLGDKGDKDLGLLQDCGKPMPFIDVIDFSLEKESVPLTGKFLQGYYDLPEVGRGDYGVAMQVAAGDYAEKAQLYADRNIQIQSTPSAQQMYFGFNWLDPIVGYGDTAKQQEKNRKLRHAISIAFDWEQFVSIFQNDQGSVAHGPLPPDVLGFVPLPKGLNPAAYDLKDGSAQKKSLDYAKQLLTQAGYPDGRNAKTGEQLILYFDSAGGGGSSAMLNWMRRQLQKLKIQLEVRATDYNRFQDKMRNGTAQMYMWGWVADYPDAENFLFLLYGANAKAINGGENASNYQNSEFDALFEQMRYLNDGPEKEAIIHKMIEIVQNDAPWMFGYFPNTGGAWHGWVGNVKPSQMVRNSLQYYKIDNKQRQQSIKQWNAPVLWPIWILVLGGLVLVILVWRHD